jgi:hypothetical protein
VNEQLGADNDNTWRNWLGTRRGKLEAAATAICFVALAVLLVMLFRGPDTEDGTKRSLARTTTTETSAATTLTSNGEVEQAYRDFDAMFTRLGPAPDPGDPEIARRTTGELRGRIESALTDRVTRGLVLKLGPSSGLRAIVSTTVDGNSATLKSCYVDQSATVDAKTGAEIKTMTTITTLQTWSFVHEGGTWKASRLRTDDDHSWQGVYDCGV